MSTVGAFQAKTHFSALLEKVGKGEEITITKHGHAVAKLVPMGGKNKEHIHSSIQQLKEWSKKHRLGGLSWKKLRDEGRR